MATTKLANIQNMPSWRRGPKPTSTDSLNAGSSTPSPSLETLTTLHVDELVIGAVYKLPQYQDVPTDSPIMKHPSWRKDAGSHPCILVAKGSNGTVEVLPCTSFGGHGISKYHEHCLTQRAWYWLIEHSKEKPHDNTPLVKLAPGSKWFTKATYVKVGAQDIYTLDANLLQSWNRNPRDLITLDKGALMMVQFQAKMSVVSQFKSTVPAKATLGPSANNSMENWRKLTS